ncbi:MAG: hypothetical protein B6D34_07340 [Candidatus Brocadia sp. UTAMX1]|jgi:hypothetical protein|nr:MAG: hypothetical protein B6D34_07340 [Candidatus Brocadia sp. UTAMX1]
MEWMKLRLSGIELFSCGMEILDNIKQHDIVKQKKMKFFALSAGVSFPLTRDILCVSIKIIENR